MHQTRQAVPIRIPIKRKGTKYIVVTKGNAKDSVSVLLAIRDMLHFAKTTKEVQKMIHTKLIKLNGRNVRDYRESISLFNILEAGNAYILSILPSGRLTLIQTKDKETRLCKVTNKLLFKGKMLELNLHDGTNVLSKEKIEVNDTVYLDLKNKIKKHVKMENGKNVFIISGKYTGQEGKVKKIEGKEAEVDLKDKSIKVNLSSLIAR